VNAELPAFFKKLPSRNLLTMKESLPIKIRDSVALVTGANRGLGLAFVEELLTQLADFLQKKPSFRRENYATRTETQEVHANFILQVLHVSAQRRLRHPKLRGCLGGISTLHQPPESIADVVASPFSNPTMPRKHGNARNVVLAGFKTGK